MVTGCGGGGAAGGPTLDSMLGDRMASTCAMAGWLSSSTLRSQVTLAGSVTKSPSNHRTRNGRELLQPRPRRYEVSLGLWRD
jgi:hypothetical protein